MAPRFGLAGGAHKHHVQQTCNTGLGRHGHAAIDRAAGNGADGASDRTVQQGAITDDVPAVVAPRLHEACE